MRMSRCAAHIHDPTVNIAKLLEAKQPRAVCRVIEDVRLPRAPQSAPIDNVEKDLLLHGCSTYCGRVDGHGPRVGRLIGLMAWSDRDCQHYAFVWRSECGRASVQLQRLEVLCDLFGHGEALVLRSVKIEL